MPIPAGSGPTPAIPSGPLYYDPVLSRVRLAVPGQPVAVNDHFDRTVSNGWGATWAVSGAATSAFSVNGVAGVHAVGAVHPTVYRSLLPVGMRDLRLRLGAMLWPIMPTGEHVRTEIGVRYVDADNQVRISALINPGGAVDLRIESIVAGVVTELDAVSTGYIHSAGVSLVADVEALGGRISASVWKDGNLEPAAWQVSVSDPNPQIGDVSILSLAAPANSNSKPFNTIYDALTITPLAQVERSTDMVRWTTVRGGEAVVISGDALRLDDYEFAPDVPNHYRMAGYAGTIVPALDRVWLKSIARPFLNRPVTVVDYSDVERPSRAGLFDVAGRSMPVAVTDVRGSRRWTLEVLTGTAGEADDLDLLLASGDVIFVQVPADTGVPAGYVIVGDTRARRTSRLGTRRVFELPCTEVAAPTADIVGATVTCQSVLNLYPTCAAVLAAHPTCLSLMELIGDPTDVIVP